MPVITLKQAIQNSISQFNIWANDRILCITNGDELRGIFTEFFKRECRTIHGFGGISNIFKPSIIGTFLLEENKIKYISFRYPSSHPSRDQKEFINACDKVLADISLRQISQPKNSTEYMSQISEAVNSIHNYKF